MMTVISFVVVELEVNWPSLRLSRNWKWPVILLTYTNKNCLI